MSNFITLADIQPWFPVSVNLDEDAANAYITAAQEFALRNVLGDDLYDALVVDWGSSPIPARMIAILPSIKQYLAFATLSEIAVVHGTAITRYDIVQKQTDFSDTLNDYRRGTFGKTMEGRRAEMERRLVKFIYDNRADYPEFAYGDGPGMPPRPVGFFTS